MFRFSTRTRAVSAGDPPTTGVPPASATTPISARVRSDRRRFTLTSTGYPIRRLRRIVAGRAAGVSSASTRSWSSLVDAVWQALAGLDPNRKAVLGRRERAGEAWVV